MTKPTYLEMTAMTTTAAMILYGLFANPWTFLGAMAIILFWAIAAGLRSGVISG